MQNIEYSTILKSQESYSTNHLNNRICILRKSSSTGKCALTQKHKTYKTFFLCTSRSFFSKGMYQFSWESNKKQSCGRRRPYIFKSAFLQVLLLLLWLRYSLAAWNMSRYGFFSGSYLPAFWLNTTFSPYSAQMRENTDQIKLCISTVFTLCCHYLWKQLKLQTKLDDVKQRSLL